MDFSSSNSALVREPRRIDPDLNRQLQGRDGTIRVEGNALRQLVMIDLGSGPQGAVWMGLTLEQSRQLRRAIEAAEEALSLTV